MNFQIVFFWVWTPNRNPVLFVILILRTSRMAHKTYFRCALFVSANSFASTTALARSIEGACEMPPYLSAFNLSYERAFGGCAANHAANQEMHITTQKYIYSASQDTAENGAESVKPIR